jgi:thiamine-phosphate diphosphorylase
MRPLPRLHAFTDPAVIALEDFAARAAAIAAAGSAVALHARNREATAEQLTALTGRLLALAAPPEASVFVNGRPDLVRALHAHGVQLSAHDLPPHEARRVLGPVPAWIGRSVHSVDEARAAVDEGADYLVVGNVYKTSTHPGRPPTGLALVANTARLGLPVIAIGGITPVRAIPVRNAGAWGVAAISALWHASDPAAAATRLLEPWTREG